MKNEEKYKTPKERTEAFHRFCKNTNDCCVCPVGKEISNNTRCPFAWLALEAEEEKPLPCPFCGGEAEVVLTNPMTDKGVYIHCKECGAFVTAFHTKADAIAAWNRRAK